MKLYNTMSKQKEEFIPLEEGKVRMYVCGPTVYNYIHIGNARPMIVFDTVRRYFEYKGYDVNYVSNFTDVDDKIIKKANEELQALYRRMQKRYGGYERASGDDTSAGNRGDRRNDRADRHIDRKGIRVCKERNGIFSYETVQRLRETVP